MRSLWWSPREVEIDQNKVNACVDQLNASLKMTNDIPAVATLWEMQTRAAVDAYIKCMKEGKKEA
jgi:hypothetical protein